MKAHHFVRSALVIAGCFVFFTAAAGQAGRGMARLKGLVVDEAGNPVSQARVEIILQPTQEAKREAFTNKKGEWAIIGLSSGTWAVTAMASGFQPASTDCVIRQLERNPILKMTLKRIPLGESTKAESESSRILIDQANSLYKEKKYDEALAAYQDLLIKNPTVYQINISIGDCYREIGDGEKAMEYYNLAAEKALSDLSRGKEQRAKALARIGEIYIKKEDYENAQAAFKQSIETFPENEVLAYNVGEIYFSNQKLDDAIHYFAIAAQIKPDWSDAYYKLGLTYLNKADYVHAQENLNKFLELESDTERSANVKNILDYIGTIKK